MYNDLQSCHTWHPMLEFVSCVVLTIEKQFNCIYNFQMTHVNYSIRTWLKRLRPYLAELVTNLYYMNFRNRTVLLPLVLSLQIKTNCAPVRQDPTMFCVYDTRHRLCGTKKRLHLQKWEWASAMTWHGRYGIKWRNIVEQHFMIDNRNNNSTSQLYRSTWNRNKTHFALREISWNLSTWSWHEQERQEAIGCVHSASYGT